MALSISVTARKLFNYAELVTSGKLNLAQFITIALSGTASTAQIADGAVTPAKTSQGPWHWGTDAGSAGSCVVTVTPAFTSYVAGLQVAFVAAATNTGTTLVNVSGLGTKAVFTAFGQPLEAGDIRAGVPVYLRYDGTQFYLVNPVYNQNVRYGIATGTANDITLTHAGGSNRSPTVSAYYRGLTISFLAALANTSNVTVAVDGLTAVPLLAFDGTALTNGAIIVGQAVSAVYDYTLASFLMTSPVGTISPANNTPAIKLFLNQNYR